MRWGELHFCRLPTHTRVDWMRRLEATLNALQNPAASLGGDPSKRQPSGARSPGFEGVQSSHYSVPQHAHWRGAIKSHDGAAATRIIR